jgi:hypothetical protein
MLKEFARRAYPGDREKRGVKYWARIATEIWHAYAHLMAVREQTARIIAQDEERIDNLPERRAAAAKRARRYRERLRALRSSDQSCEQPERAGETSPKHELGVTEP